jgi:hypothetical protein
MELGFKNKIILVLSACIAFTVVFAEPLIADGHDHNCIGEGCPVCLQIEAAKCFLKTLKLAGIGLFFAPHSLLSVQAAQKNNYIAHSLSPVLLKVRFNS